MVSASQIVNVVPNVVDVGGDNLELIGLILTNSTRAPINSVVRLTSAAAVSAYFGPLSQEYALAQVYFAGYDGSTAKPAALLFWQYPAVAVVAYLRGGTPQTLAQLQALASGVITLTIDGRSVTSSSMLFASATSFSDVAALIQSALADKDASTTGSISGTALTVSSGTGIAVGQIVTGSGVTVGTKIVSGSGTSWVVSVSQTVASTTLTFGATLVTYDSISGSFVITAGTPGTGTISVASGTDATALGLTTAAGAVTSQGAPIATPAGAMAAVIAQTQNFASFMTAFKPSTADMVLFAAWNNTRSRRFAYMMHDNDAVPAGSTDTSSAMYQIIQAAYEGTAGIWDPTNGATLAAFAMGFAASLNFNAVNGRATAAFKHQAGLVAGVTDDTIASNLQLHGYNFYGNYNTANDSFLWFINGTISGEFKYLDSYLDQIWLNSSLQVALMTLLDQIGHIPYNNEGYTQIEQAMSGPVQAALSFGAIQPNIVLSATQIASVNAAAGKDISSILQTRGWYISVTDPGPTIRAARGSPICYVFYCDGQSVQKITVSSNEVE